MHGLGGRMATRIIDSKPFIFDHAAQFFTVSDLRFQKLVDRWLEKGLVREWKGLLVELEAGGQASPLPYSASRYVGMKGMRSLMDSIITLPTNTPEIPCIFDPNGRAGICGDWLLGSSVEAAALIIRLHYTSVDGAL
ncbi:hypothetical protein B296_00019050 [Ensete ventricosum]|uniref:Uncharacterized protein n=1 Tax=Ensete ventricosum TaxID=4639 RepID=A0A427AAF9_ENSVE|nr:hypothetical protein B296_00019050 [Ensete ventricosum]